LPLLNERGGETNIACGWHAIEFLLWGQDFNETGPGQRPFTDYTDSAPNHERRARYLKEATALLCQHLQLVKEAWAKKKGSYRETFIKSPDASVEKLLTGLTILAGFEISGERLAVPFETGDQEDEHSCFSDTTHDDFIDNVRGIAAVYRGGLDRKSGDAQNGLRALARAAAPEVTDLFEQQLATLETEVRGLPAPFDQTLRAPAGSAPKKAMERLLNAAEDLAQTLVQLGKSLGYTIPLRPGE
ncbi:MAG: imelysin family protein, partial [Verrucomicrobiota bacterium]